VVKEVAQLAGVYATFMPKPIFGEAGSGMHVHQSLFRGGDNAFYDADGEYHLSDIARSYVAGLLVHAREICAVTNQWVNSYKRLVSGYEAPVYVCWANRNRSALVRVPMYKPGKEKATRIELRSPDPACNPYLAVTDNIYEMSDVERAKLGIGSLPKDLSEAIECMEGSDMLRRALGDQVFEWFLLNKKKEWDTYRSRVTPYELEEYLPIL
jgi:glutamine synthetase